jgi:hypothetical protein
MALRTPVLYLELLQAIRELPALRLRLKPSETLVAAS